jgi:phage tail-like protein
LPDKNAMNSDPGLFVPFRFRVSFSHQYAPAAVGKENAKNKFDLVACKGEFSEITGLEFNTTPKTIKEGGRNWGDVQLTTPVTFSNLVLKRGITRDTELWRWYRFIYRTGVYAYRADCIIEVLEPYRSEAGEDIVRMRWIARNCVPVKFKGSDLNATASGVAIEELHLAHEGLEVEWLEQQGGAAATNGGENAA